MQAGVRAKTHGGGQSEATFIAGATHVPLVEKVAGEVEIGTQPPAKGAAYHQRIRSAIDPFLMLEVDCGIKCIAELLTVARSNPVLDGQIACTITRDRQNGGRGKGGESRVGFGGGGN